MTRPLTSRALAVLGAAALTLGLAACGGNDAAETTDATGTGTATATTEATEAGTDDTQDAGPAEGAVEAEDGSFSVVLPEGFTQEPTEMPVEGDAPVQEGTAMLLQASKANEQSEEGIGDGSVIMASVMPEQPLDDLVAQLVAGYAQVEEMGLEGVETTVSEPIDVELDGEPAKLVRASTSYADEAAEMDMSVAVDMIVGNHDGSTYSLVYTGSIVEGDSPLAGMADTWRWN